MHTDLVKPYMTFQSPLSSSTDFAALAQARVPLSHSYNLVCSLCLVLNIIFGLLFTFEGPVSHLTHRLCSGRQFGRQGLCSSIAIGVPALQTSTIGPWFKFILHGHICFPLVDQSF